MNVRLTRSTPWGVVVALGLFAVLKAAPAAAQPDGPGRLYRLLPESEHQEGCFDPCDCITHYISTLTGTFRLRQTSVDPLFTNYEVSEVVWQAPEINRTATGSGTYRVGGEFALTHQLVLDLQLSGYQEAMHFDSLLVPGGSEFPVIDIVITVNNFECY